MNGRRRCCCAKPLEQQPIESSTAVKPEVQLGAILREAESLGLVENYLPLGTPFVAEGSGRAAPSALSDLLHLGANCPLFPS